MVEFSPWDGKAREGEPMPLDRNEIDAIPLSGESILIRTGSTMAQGIGSLIFICYKRKKKPNDSQGPPSPHLEHMKHLDSLFHDF